MGMMYILAALIDWDRDSLDRLISIEKTFQILKIFPYITLNFSYRCVLVLTLFILLRLIYWCPSVTYMHSIGIC